MQILPNPLLVKTKLYLKLDKNETSIIHFTPSKGQKKIPCAQQIFKLDESPSNYSNCKEKKKHDLQITSEFITFTTITSLLQN